MTSRLTASARARTQPGTLSCAATVTLDMVIIHATPPMNVSTSASPRPGANARPPLGEGKQQGRGREQPLETDVTAKPGQDERARDGAGAEPTEDEPVPTRIEPQRPTRHERQQRPHRARGQHEGGAAQQHAVERS